MSSTIIGILISHLLTAIEAALVAAEPTIIDEVKLLISKLEQYIESKSPKTATLVNPLLNAINANSPAIVDKSVLGVNTAVDILSTQIKKGE